ncbi:hypothetical protein TNCT_42181 [Trichonephila clavata]|uniref:Uncharacterized protein n=1 Tax=Trichonephila clavata TaxID=2740835 RepID=A0A8X6LQH1_TRICU|nr:hypothetical protein TNCT_42181 [Trichonephila clavata]
MVIHLNRQYCAVHLSMSGVKSSITTTYRQKSRSNERFSEILSGLNNVEGYWLTADCFTIDHNFYEKLLDVIVLSSVVILTSLILCHMILLLKNLFVCRSVLHLLIPYIQH